MCNVYKKYDKAKQQHGQSVYSLIWYLEELESNIIFVPKDHQISTILGALYPWIEAQVSNLMKLPKSKSELIELALKVKSIATYRGHNSGTHTFQGSRNGIDNVGGGKRGKRVSTKVHSSRNNTSGLTTSQVQKDKPIFDTRPTCNLSTVKYYKSGHIGHIVSSSSKSSKILKIPILRNV